RFKIRIKMKEIPGNLFEIKVLPTLTSELVESMYISGKSIAAISRELEADWHVISRLLTVRNRRNC
ncbi:MAG: hypothetical protein ABI999_07120, partial [Acidobacteriota bacterium]